MASTSPTVPTVPTGTDSEAAYRRDIAALPRLSAAEEQALGRRAQAGDIAARNRLVESNLGLAFKLARRYHRPPLAILDLVQAGNEGLIAAADRFDPSRNVPFGAYAAYWIERQLREFTLQHSTTVRAPVYRATAIQKIMATEEKLRHLMGRAPRLDEVAEYARCTLAEVEEARWLTTDSVSLDATHDEDDHGLESSIAQGTYLAPDLLPERAELRRIVDDLLAELPEVEALVLTLSCGLRGQVQRTYEQIATELKTSRDRVRRLESQAKKRISQSPRARQLFAELRA